MGAYTADELPILYGLAERFAVSDRWFSSVPTETDPNRDFASCGTSEGKETDLDPPFSVSAPTIFNALNDLDTSWAIYAQADFGGPPFTNSGITYSELHFDGVRSAIADPQSRGAVLPYEDLLDRLKSGGELPSFCWVEPAWGWGLGDADGFVGWQGNEAICQRGSARPKPISLICSARLLSPRSGSRCCSSSPSTNTAARGIMRRRRRPRIQMAATARPDLHSKGSARACQRFSFRRSSNPALSYARP
jgi:hypothetical protein